MTGNHGTDRRRFLRAGAAVALSLGVAGCSAVEDVVDDVGSGDGGDGGSGGDGGGGSDGDDGSDGGSGDAGPRDLRAIAYGETKQGYIEESDGRDPEYGDVAEPVSFEGEAGDRVEIVAEVPDVSAYLVLTGPDDEFVAEHQRGSGARSVIETRLPETGTYTVWVGSTTGAGRGAYTLTLERAGTDA